MPTILYVEDFPPVRSIIRETLELEGWRVEVCEEGTSARREIEGGIHYDLLLLDEDLPGANGIELVRRARSLVHRRHTPIVMLSASDRQREARQAGANAFLKKPEGLLLIVETVRQLLTAEDNQSAHQVNWRE